MRLDLTYRLAGYAALALSSACLIHAEQLFLPGVGWLLPPVLLVLAAAWFLEGRWALPVWAGNTLAVLICGAMAIILSLHISADPESFAALVPVPVALVPYAGPALIVLLLIKLFRARRSCDGWQLQMMGLLQVGLACVLGGDPLFGLLLNAYFLAALWWLALAYLQRRQEQAGAAAQRPLVPWRLAGALRVGRWLVIVMACAVVLALATPRISPSPWNPLELLGRVPPRARAETGVPAWIDLNRTGQVAVNNEVVMEIQAEDGAGNPKLDLPSDQRFRGMYLDAYEDGRWRTTRGGPGDLLSAARPQQVQPFDKMGRGPGMQMLSKAPGPNVGSPRPFARKGIGVEYFDPSGVVRPEHAPRLPGLRLPDFGPEQYLLTFTLKPRKAGGLFLAEPFLLLPELNDLPVMAVNPLQAPHPLFSELNGSVVHPPPQRGVCEYRQVSRPVDDSDFSPPVDITVPYQLTLCTPPPASLQMWIDELVGRLVERGYFGLQVKDVEFAPTNDRRIMLPAKRDKLARALCAYLRSSGEYTYTLDLRRQDRDLDPTEDFLRNVKQGHCERYAGALALMLRARGIPARLVKGYRGCQASGDGSYQVRNSDAHTWVEALVARTEPRGRPRLHWLALDPTPETEAPSAASFSLGQWWANCRDLTSEVWRVFVSEYGPEEQTALADELWNRVAPHRHAVPRSVPSTTIAVLTLGGIMLVAAPTMLILARRRRRRRNSLAARAPSVSFYARLLTLLARHARLRAAPSQTPQEFADSAARLLRESAPTAALADVPAQVAALYYRIRYGGETLAEAERQSVEGRLDELAAALLARRRVAAAPGPA